ncbi:MAG: ATP-binding cassette domain-containing protein [Halofilum sp. (in: g-proteobacteria)]|nr:ATP-binding cassette domain-containing protein [Halofilum sp. (in: g-proteobacteria)]
MDEGEIVTIIGPNGAGKSTLLKAIMGHVPLTRGRVLLESMDVGALRPDQRVRAGVGYVPQLCNVFPSLTIEENLLMGGYILDKPEARQRMERQFEAFPRIAERRRQHASNLSGGERQMLAMARVLMTEPKLMLLDEPSAALSPKLSRRSIPDCARDQSRRSDHRYRGAGGRGGSGHIQPRIRAYRWAERL